MKITVFYDGKCGLCTREINHYRKIAPAGVFHWQDITDSSKDLKKMGISLAQGLEFLHARDKDGHMHIGIDAFILIWRQLKRWNTAATIISLPVMKPIARWGYNAFARWRFKRLAHCQLAAKGETT